MAEMMTRTCLTCGRSFERIYDKRPNRGKFCSRECYYIYQRKKFKGEQIAVPPLKYDITIPSEEWKLAYLACAVDTDGSVGLKTNNYSSYYKKQPYLAVYNTAPVIIDWLLTTFKGRKGKIGTPKSGYKQEWYWQIRALREVEALIEAILPYMTVKKERAKEVLRYTKDYIKHVKNRQKMEVIAQ